MFRSKIANNYELDSRKFWVSAKLAMSSQAIYRANDKLLP